MQSAKNAIILCDFWYVYPMIWLFDQRTEERARERADMRREEEDDQEKMGTMIITQMIMIVFVNNITNFLFFCFIF